MLFIPTPSEAWLMYCDTGGRAQTVRQDGFCVCRAGMLWRTAQAGLSQSGDEEVACVRPFVGRVNNNEESQSEYGVVVLHPL